MSSNHSPTLTIVIPVYNDWESLDLLLQKIDDNLSGCQLGQVNVLAIDDASVTDHGIVQKQLDSMQTINAIHVVHLSCNLGSQRSIATGLAYTANELQSDIIIVMDSDGEDRPEELPRLLDMHNAEPDKVIVAERSKRSETLLFRVMYQVYKMLFRLLTGQGISFGNFCLIPANQIKKLIYRSELWINLPATIIRSRIPFEKIPTVRGKRLLGKSSMNFVGLVAHGMSAISVYSDSTLVRMLFVFLGLGGFSLLLLLGVFITPGNDVWHINNPLFYFAMLLLFVSIQSAIITMIVILHLFSNWSQNPMIPNIHYENYIWQVEEFRTVETRA